MSLSSLQQVAARGADQVGVLHLRRASSFPRGCPRARSASISRLLSGVRSSCDMFAMNSDLYFEETASCSAFSSTRRLAASTSPGSFARPRRSARRAAGLLGQVLVGALDSSSWRDCSSCAWDCDCLSRFSVRRVGLDRVEHEPDALGELIEEAWWVGLNGLNEASSTTARTAPSNRIGSTMMFSGVDSPRPELIWT